jgi:chromate transporter
MEADEITTEMKSCGSTLEVFLAFLRLGLTAFGGPVAHIGYFQAEFVKRRKWLDEEAYADLVALCQFLPGPASSQVGFALGLRRAGALGALAAWTGFTLPSAILMTAFAFGANFMTNPWAQGALHGLKLVAVAVVAQAVWGMARKLTPDLQRLIIAGFAMLAVTFLAGALGQIGSIVLGGVAGLIVCRGGPADSSETHHPVTVPKWVGLAALVLFFALLVGVPFLATATGNAALGRFDAFYRSGALVFGGGHVVLPLLKQAVVDRGWIGQDSFLVGYGAAQAMPGPLFTFAAYLGAAMRTPPNGLAGATLGIIGIFLPGMLALLAALPFWSRVQGSANARAAMRGANASVVGILAAALYNPVWTSSVHNIPDMAIAGVGFALLTWLKAPPIVVVVMGAAAGVLRVMFPF